MSKPRAATSVATRISSRPFLSCATVSSRRFWAISPLSAALAYPRASNISDSSTVIVRVRTKISIPSKGSASRIRVRASTLFSFPLTSQCRWRILSAADVRSLISICAGSRRCLAAIRRIGSGIVAEKSAVWWSSGVCSNIHSTSSIKPMRSISSASSSTRQLSSSIRSVLRRMWSITRPGVPTTTCTPRLSDRNWPS